MSSFRRSKFWVFLGFHAGTWKSATFSTFSGTGKREMESASHLALQKATLMDIFSQDFEKKNGSVKRNGSRPFDWAFVP